jgi:hypothetical protein
LVEGGGGGPAVVFFEEADDFEPDLVLVTGFDVVLGAGAVP